MTTNHLGTPEGQRELALLRERDALAARVAELEQLLAPAACTTWDRTDTLILGYRGRIQLAWDQVLATAEARGGLTDSDLLDAAEAWTTSDFNDNDNDLSDFGRLMDDLYRVLAAVTNDNQGA
jgi:hypothetical protein